MWSYRWVIGKPSPPFFRCLKIKAISLPKSDDSWVRSTRFVSCISLKQDSRDTRSLNLWRKARVNLHAGSSLSVPRSSATGVSPPNLWFSVWGESWYSLPVWAWWPLQTFLIDLSTAMVHHRAHQGGLFNTKASV